MTVTEQSAQERGSGDEVNDGDVEGAAEEVEGRRLPEGAEYPTMEELIKEDYEDQTEERGGEQDDTMEEGEDEGGPSRTGDETAHATIQDKRRDGNEKDERGRCRKCGRLREQRCWNEWR